MVSGKPQQMGVVTGRRQGTSGHNACAECQASRGMHRRQTGAWQSRAFLACVHHTSTSTGKFRQEHHSRGIFAKHSSLFSLPSLPPSLRTLSVPFSFANPRMWPSCKGHYVWVGGQPCRLDTPCLSVSIKRDVVHIEGQGLMHNIQGLAI